MEFLKEYSLPYAMSEWDSCGLRDYTPFIKLCSVTVFLGDYAYKFLNLCGIQITSQLKITNVRVFIPELFVFTDPFPSFPLLRSTGRTAKSCRLLCHLAPAGSHPWDAVVGDRRVVKGKGQGTSPLSSLCLHGCSSPLDRPPWSSYQGWLWKHYLFPFDPTALRRLTAFSCSQPLHCLAIRPGFTATPSPIKPTLCATFPSFYII